MTWDWNEDQQKRGAEIEYVHSKNKGTFGKELQSSIPHLRSCWKKYFLSKSVQSAEQVCYSLRLTKPEFSQAVTASYSELLQHGSVRQLSLVGPQVFIISLCYSEHRKQCSPTRVNPDPPYQHCPRQIQLPTTEYRSTGCTDPHAHMTSFRTIWRPLMPRERHSFVLFGYTI